MFVLLFFYNESKATHLVGGFISYRFQRTTNTGVIYRITIVSYRDCKQGSIEFSKNIDVCFYNQSDKLLNKSVEFTIGQQSRVNPVGRTDCPQAADVCLERAIYVKEVELPTSSFGYIVKYETCCRNEQVNLRNNNDGAPFIGQTYQTIIPPTNFRNSSPFFQDVPVPFICINDTSEVSNYAIDPDGDSLVYRIATPWYGASLSNNFPGCTPRYTAPVPISASDYETGFNGNIPFGANGLAKIDSRNGITTYFSRRIGNFAIAIDLEEYRNGILISSTRLDLQIIVINCPPNNKPTVSLDNNNTSILAGGKLCFNVIGNDRDDQNLTISAFGDIITGSNGFQGNVATFETKTGRRPVSSEFCWQTTCEQASNEPYIFTARVVDDGCPSKFTIKNFNITVRPYNPNIVINGPNSLCQGSKNNLFTFQTSMANAGDLVGTTYRFNIVNGTLVSSVGNDLIINWNTGSNQGIIEITPISRFDCPGKTFTKIVTLIPAPPIPNILQIDTVCENTNKIYSTPNTNGFTYRWWVENGSVIGSNNNNSINITWGAPGLARAKLIQINSSNCPSDTAFLNVWVSKPNTSPIIGRNSVCPNSTQIDYQVLLKSYNSQFEWFISGGTITQNNPSHTIKVNWGNQGIGRLKLLERDRFGCVGDTVYKSVIKDYNLTADSIKGDTNICEFTNNVKYSVTAVNGSTFNWAIVGGTIVSGNGTNEIIVNWGASAVGEVSVYETSFDPINNLPCVSNVFVLRIRIRPYPTATTIVGTLEFCQFTGDYDFTLNGFANSRYDWFINGDSNNIVGQSTNTIRISSNTPGTYLLRVIETTEFGCEGNPIETTVIVHPKPTTSAILGDSIICYPNNNNHNYSVSGFNTSTFDWYIFGGTITNPSQNNSINVNWSGVAKNWLKVLETSDFGCEGDTQYLNVFYDNPSVFLNYITVNPPPASDNGIEVYWKLINAPRYNNDIFIESRIYNSGNNFSLAGTVNKSLNTFNHSPINTDSNAYEYRVRIQNLCNEPVYSQNHTNILLRGSKTAAYDVAMNFTPYFGWNLPIQYDMFRLLRNLTPYEIYEPTITDFQTNYSNGLEYFTQCYRVKGTKSGSDTSTWSNDICFNFDPLIFFPTAFSPNNDDYNEQYFIKGGALKTVDYAIFNRWGEKLFVGNSLADKWDGTYKGVDQPQDVYMYTCIYTDYKGTVYSTKGTITLLR